MMSDTIFSASADEEKNGRFVEFVWIPLAAESLIIVFALVSFWDHVMVHKERKQRRRMAGFFIGFFDYLKLKLLMVMKCKKSVNVDCIKTEFYIIALNVILYLGELFI